MPLRNCKGGLYIGYFEIPVYSYTKETAQNYWDEFYRKLASGKNYDEDQQNKIITELKNKDYPKHVWKYNEIVGYITINKQGRDIGGYLYKDKHERIQIGGVSKIYLIHPRLFRISVKKTYNASQITYTINKEINLLQKEHNWLKKRYICTEAFRNICSYIDWKQIFEIN